MALPAPLLASDFTPLRRIGGISITGHPNLRSHDLTALNSVWARCRRRCQARRRGRVSVLSDTHAANLPTPQLTPTTDPRVPTCLSLPFMLELPVALLVRHPASVLELPAPQSDSPWLEIAAVAAQA